MAVDRIFGAVEDQVLVALVPRSRLFKIRDMFGFFRREPWYALDRAADMMARL
jgi:hypothetical protein